MSEKVDTLPDNPWVLVGSFMSADTRRVEVNTADELLTELNRMMDLSPTSEVIISKSTSWNE